MSWPSAPLGSVATLERDGENPSALHSETRYVGLEHIDGDGIIASAATVGTAELKSTKFRFCEDHILYGKLRPYLRKIARPGFAGVCSTDIIPIRPSTAMDRGYLFHFLRTPKMVDLATSRCTGANLPRLNPSQLEAFEIPLPSLPEQKRIAAILDAADALRAKRRESIEQLDSLIQATFLEMFGDPVTNPQGWDVRTLGEACLGKPTYGSGAPASEYDPALPRYVRITDINEAGQLGNERKSAAISPDESEQYRLKLGDLLFARSGATVGKTYLYRQTDGPCVYAGYLIRFCPNPTVLLPEVLFRFTQTRAYWRWVESVARAVAQPNINAKMYAGLNLVIPPLGLQTRFASIVESIEQQKARLKAHLAELDTLFASLQSRAFNGELVA